MHKFIAISLKDDRFALAEGLSLDDAHDSVIELQSNPDSITYWRTDEGYEIELADDGVPFAVPDGVCSLIDWVPGQDGYPEPEPVPDSPIDRTDVVFDELCDEQRRPSERASELVQSAQLIRIVDVMSRRAMTMYGSDIYEKAIPVDTKIAVLVVELDFDSIEVAWLVALVRKVKGSAEIDGGPIQ